jgi:predicted nucleic acid-binding protein
MKIVDALKSVNLLGVDTVAFIYFVESHPGFVAETRAIFNYVSTGSVRVITSVITLTESLMKPIKVGDVKLIADYKTLFTNTSQITLIPIDSLLAEQAANLRAKYNLRTPDAIQVATAIQAGCQAFLTNDKGIKRVTELQILVLDELEI